VQIRDQGRLRQGYQRKKGRELSRPDEAAWILKCENSSYRVRLIPDMAAKVELLD
jgi:hypothetical protein